MRQLQGAHHKGAQKPCEGLQHQQATQAGKWCVAWACGLWHVACNDATPSSNFQAAQRERAPVQLLCKAQCHVPSATCPSQMP